MAVVGDAVYIAEAFAGRVSTVPVGGGAVTPVATGLGGPRSLSATGDTLYVAEYGAGRVIAVPLSGGSIEIVAADLSGPAGVAVR